MLASKPFKLLRVVAACAALATVVVEPSLAPDQRDMHEYMSLLHHATA